MKRLAFLAAAVSVVASAAPALAETVNCTNITALPQVITAPGVYCLKQDLATSMTSGNAITINANSVTIDFNGYRLGGLGGGPATQATGVYAYDRKNITLRNGNIRGFQSGIALNGSGSISGGHVIEDNLLDGSRFIGVVLALSSDSVIRRNRILNTTSTGGRPALGIAVENSKQIDVADNLVVGTTQQSGAGAYAIRSYQSSTVNIVRNTTLDTQAAGSFVIGISVVNQPASGSTTTIADNVILGGAGPQDVLGIESTQGTALCKNNVVSGFADGQTSGCTAQAGTFPPPGP